MISIISSTSSSNGREDCNSFQNLSSAQISVDAMLENFSEQASDPKMIVAMVGAGLAYRLTRAATLSAGMPLLSSNGAMLPTLVRGTSYSTALAAESFTFTAINRSFHASSAQHFHQEWLDSAISLGSLKLFGSFAEGQNIVLQHLCSDLGMVSAHRFTSVLGLQAASQDDFLTQLFQAEVMNWQMKAGMSFVRSFLPGISRFQNSLDLTLRSQERGFRTRSLALSPQFAFARAEELFKNETIASEENPFSSKLFAMRAEGAARSFQSREGRSVRPYVTAKLMGLVMRSRTRGVVREDYKKEILREKLIVSLPAALRAKIRKWGENYGIVFIPGMYNQFPDPTWMNLVSSAFGKGGVVVSAAVGEDRVYAEDLYATVGENRRVLQPHWQMEVAHVLRRINLALKDPALFQNTDRLVILGHSKGGLLTHALKALQLIYEANQNSFPEKFHRLYPGIQDVSPEDLGRVMEVLKKSKFVLLGSPVEGIDYNLLVELTDYLLLEGSAKGFDRRELLPYFDSVGIDPRRVDLIIHSRMPSLVQSLFRMSHPGNTLESLAYRTTGLLFYGISFLMRARQGDALLDTPHSYDPLLMTGRYNHVDVIVDLAAAVEVLELIFGNLEGSPYATRRR